MLEKYCSSSSTSGEASPVETWVTEQLFLDMFAHLVREQDKGVPTGTLPFMAPEQFAISEESGSSPYSPRSDIYALGVTLFFLLSGKFPQNVPEKLKGRAMSFQQSLQSWTQLHAYAHDPLPLASSVAPQVLSLSNLDHIIAQALARSSTERQSSAHQLLQQLETLLRTQLQEGKSENVQLPALVAADLPTEEERKTQDMELSKSTLPCGVLVDCTTTTAEQVVILLPLRGDDIGIFDPAAEVTFCQKWA